MVKYTNKFRVATTQIAPVWSDAGATVDKAVSWIAEAASNGAELIAFPEVFLPGYPYFLWTGTMFNSLGRFAVPYHENSLESDGPEIGRLREAARDNHIAVVCGFSERSGASLYMSQVIIGDDGEVVAKRRKLKPTHAERTLFGEGDGSDIDVYDMSMARVGALNCWEHLQTLTKFAMYSQHEQVHVASWPGMSLYQPEVYAFGVDAQLTATRMYALEGGTFVLCSTQVVDEAARDFFCDTDAERKLIGSGGGFGRIFGPDGSDLVEPLPEDAEGILYADLDLSAIALAKQAADPVGHYSRPDVYGLRFNKTPQHVTLTWDDALPLSAPEFDAESVDLLPREIAPSRALIELEESASPAS